MESNAEVAVRVLAEVSAASDEFEKLRPRADALLKEFTDPSNYHKKAEMLSELEVTVKQTSALTQRIYNAIDELIFAGKPDDMSQSLYAKFLITKSIYGLLIAVSQKELEFLASERRKLNGQG